MKNPDYQYVYIHVSIYMYVAAAFGGRGHYIDMHT